MTIKLKHTPGPWVGFVAPDSFDVMPAGRSGCVAICPRHGVYDADANSRLITAAPDMLEALMAVVAVADRKTDEFDLARAAIAKATQNS